MYIYNIYMHSTPMQYQNIELPKKVDIWGAGTMYIYI